MIRLGLRLALASGREAAVRLTIITVAVAFGVGLLLATVAGVNGVGSQNSRYAWLSTGNSEVASADASSVDPLWWLLRNDYFHGENIGRVDVAATGPRAPIPPGLPRLPGPGEFYASPALSALLRATPAAELGNRFPGRQIGTIGPSALPSPDSLLVIVGHGPDELSKHPGAEQVTSIMSADSDCAGCSLGVRGAGMTLLLSVVAAGLLFPVLMFIGTATRLSAARREQRFAAMRLVGATPRQISMIAAVESAVAAVAGTVVGFGLFLLFRPALAEIPFTGTPFFPDDLSLGVVDVLLVALGVPVAAVVTARLALRRVRISPLGVSRRVTPSPPRAWRLIPLALGIAELVFFVGRRPATTNGQSAAYLSGILLIMVGLVVAGPWLTMLGSRVMAGRATRPATLIAGRRLADNPQAGFRAVSGLMLALFVTSVATGVITTIVAERGAPRAGSTFSSSLAKTFWPEERVAGQPEPQVDAALAELRAIPGVRDATLVHESPDLGLASAGDRSMPALISCAELARLATFGGCPAGTEVAGVYPDLIAPRDMSQDPMVWPAAAVSAESLRQLPVVSIVAQTDGTAAAIERARTALATAIPQGRFPATAGEFEADFTRTLVQWQQLANVVILASLPIAGCSLAVAVVGGLTDRKRPFSMLRLTGVPLGVLRRVVALESTVPLLVVAALATGTGFLAAHLFLTSQMHYSLRAPGISYYLIVVAGLAASLAIIASTMPLLRRITGPETARNE
ncbi:FtsX-like permease family protein [Micromonospora pisi]|uniref:FtsX-like permease family protein n=1 Tax=Micromonospora pisi TaxID=589240 RepID=A0A495JRK1_9ACTN|nr:FtsX-like permease family protein [Micromonospora pisi]RKR91471.1 FtsX-like permease family protein [Micromonospora pisi]